jgi:hypothetical protein
MTDLERPAMTRDARRAFVDDCEAFLRVGILLYADWAAMDTEEKACMLVAQRRIDIEAAIVGSKAHQGPLAEAELLSEVDGGDAAVRLHIDMALVRWITSRSGAA